MSENENEVASRLRQLRSSGYLFLCTCDDGDTWTGSNDLGLPLELLIHTRRFRGNIIVQPSVPNTAQPA